MQYILKIRKIIHSYGQLNFKKMPLIDHSKYIDSIKLIDATYAVSVLKLFFFLAGIMHNVSVWVSNESTLISKTLLANRTYVVVGHNHVL